MSSKKVETIRWFANGILTTPKAYLWLATSGSIITGKPIHFHEYVKEAFGVARLHHAPISESTLETILPLKDVKFAQGDNHNWFAVALVDLEMIVAWGAYNPEESFTVPNA